MDPGERRRRYQREWVRARRQVGRVNRALRMEQPELQQNDNDHHDENQLNEVEGDEQPRNNLDGQNENSDSDGEEGVAVLNQDAEIGDDDDHDREWERGLDRQAGNGEAGAVGQIDSEDSEIENEEVLSDSEDSSEDENEDVKPLLIQWSQEFRISQVALTSLLKILRRVPNLNDLRDLPADARTLLKTMAHVDVEQVSGCDYHHIGLEAQIIKVVERFRDELGQGDEILLNVSLNTDGSPLFKSSRQQIWPLLCNVLDLPVPVVLAVTVTCGASKPTDTQYLQEGLREVLRGITNGFRLADGQLVKLKVKHVVADAPARSFVKNTIAVNGYYGCDRCEQSGVWRGPGRRGKVTYQISEPQPRHIRTDAKFRAMSNPQHHHGRSVFLDLGRQNLDMIFSFPICSMHQVYLGVFRRLIKKWISGPRDVRFSPQNYIDCNRTIRAISKNFPADFPRKPRDFEDRTHFKATECRDLMLYCCPIAFMDTMDPDMYEHFLCLSIGMSLLSTTPAPGEQAIQFAHRLLVRFVDDAKVIYGEDFIVYNVHSLVHLANEVRVHGVNLDALGAWPFENFLQIEKRQVRSGKNPVSQIVKRTVEREEAGYQPQSRKIPGLSSKRPNNFYLLDSGDICQILSFGLDGMPSCRIHQVEPAFDRPCVSSVVGIHKATGRYRQIQVPRARFVTRCIAIRHGYSQYFMAQHHKMKFT